jgi:AraC-like DNA-binding protein
MAEFRFHPSPLNGLEAVSATSAHVFPKHTHETYGIGFITVGGQISASGRGQVEAGPGQLITVNPGEVHDGAPIGRTPRSWHMLYLSQAIATDCVSDLVSSAGSLEFEFPVFADPAIRALLSASHRRLEDEEDEIDTAAFREAIILLLGKTLVRRPTLPATPIPRALARVRQRLDDDPTMPADLSLLAEDAGLSRFQLIRGFQRLTGLTPHAYLLQSRANLSRRLLAQGLSPAEVAANCGYVDQSHMHREFRRRFGLTPGAYRSAWVRCNLVQDRRA